MTANTANSTARAKKEASALSEDYKKINELVSTIWSGVFSTVNDVSLYVDHEGHPSIQFSGKEASQVASACSKAAEKALIKLMSSLRSTESPSSPSTPAAS